MRPLGWALIQSDWSYMKIKFLYTRETPGIQTHTHTGKIRRGHSERTATCRPRIEASEAKPANAFDAGFLASRMVRNFCLHHIVWYFVMAKLIHIYQQIDTNTIKILHSLSPPLPLSFLNYFKANIISFYSLNVWYLSLKIWKISDITQRLSAQLTKLSNTVLLSHNTQSILNFPHCFRKLFFHSYLV